MKHPQGGLCGSISSSQGRMNGEQVPSVEVVRAHLEGSRGRRARVDVDCEMIRSVFSPTKVEWPPNFP